MGGQSGERGASEAGLERAAGLQRPSRFHRKFERARAGVPLPPVFAPSEGVQPLADPGDAARGRGGGGGSETVRLEDKGRGWDGERERER